MKLAVIGFGNAGSKIADRMLRAEATGGRSLCRSVTAINSATIDLAKLEYVPESHRIMIGQTDPRSKGHGVGADPDVGAEVARRDYAEIERALDSVPLHDVDAFLVIAGLGGGTGSGGAPVLASNLREMYDESVYGLAILPSEDEGGRPALNAGRSLQSFSSATDALLVFDNDAWRQGGDSVGGGYERTNREIVKRVVTLLSPGEYDGSEVSENAMDASDIKRTLGAGGIGTIAYAETGIEASTREGRGLLERFRDGSDVAGRNDTDPATKVHGLVRQAVRSRLTCPANVASAERALIVLSGPPQEFSRKGLERARRWMEDEIGSAEVLAGDDPRRSADVLSATILLANVTDVPRIDRLQEQAVDAQDSIREKADGREEEIRNLITDEEGRLDPV